MFSLLPLALPQHLLRYGFKAALFASQPVHGRWKRGPSTSISPIFRCGSNAASQNELHPVSAAHVKPHGCVTRVR